MANEAASTRYATLSQDPQGGLPSQGSVCKHCTIPGSLFSISAADGPHEGDDLLGIASRTGANFSWFTQNPWIRDKEKNARQTFLERVLLRLGEVHGDAYLAELFAFLAVQQLALTCLDEEIAADELPPAVLDNLGRRLGDGSGFSLERNFFFTDHQLYYATFTTAHWEEAPRREFTQADGSHGISLPFTWHKPRGLFPVELAAQQLAQHFDQAKATARFWEGVLGGAQAVVGALAFIPVVRGISLIARAPAGVRYVFAALEGALAADAMVDGSSRMITGEGLSLGEGFFVELARLANPSTAEARGKQVFMAINLALLLPAAWGGARWLMHRFRRDAVATIKFDNAALSAEELKRIGRRETGEVSALETRIDKAPVRGEPPVRISELHSVETNASLITLEVAAGKADFAFMARSLRQRLVSQIALATAPQRMGGRLASVVGDAGEEALVAGLLEHWKVSPGKVLGLSTDPAVASRYGLKNRSDHGIDMLVLVPPPPSLTLRNAPTATMRDHIDGVKGLAPLEVMRFEEETLLVIEVKATLGKSRTPGLLATQSGGGEKNLERVLNLTRSGAQGWSRKNMLAVDRDMDKKISTINKSMSAGRIEFVHAQVFFDPLGNLNRLTGNGTGIQLNHWR
ncbi:hypothetical protein [Pseudomonas fontis]|uniref:Tox-REase-7 domain-containing protein n=1 Tax=Pseudomonas fontis TaxID=2942633 RepID=A0ABT5NZ08_9PSED|nr:hypothetical protein [Pseudomonas fontis]MDD0977586.1 hypothetical protein [Pseudomonas fontis]MDD0993436.1 hypothetical protein [Pseudomonas fontis]